MGIDTSDLRKLAGDLRTNSGRVGRAASAALDAAAKAVRDDAKRRAPVRTGALRDSIESSRWGDGRFTEAKAYVGTTIRQGAFQEFGTGKMAPQPYLAPALASQQDAYVAAIEKLAGDIL